MKAFAKSCLDCTFSRPIICLITHTEISLWPCQRGSVPGYLNKKSKSSDSNQVQQPRVQTCRPIHSDKADETHVSPVSQGPN